MSDELEYLGPLDRLSPEMQKQVNDLFTSPEFLADLDRAEAELEAGKGVRYRVVDGELVRVKDGEPLIDK